MQHMTSLTCGPALVMAFTSCYLSLVRVDLVQSSTQSQSHPSQMPYHSGLLLHRLGLISPLLFRLIATGV